MEKGTRQKRDQAHSQAVAAPRQGHRPERIHAWRLHGGQKVPHDRQCRIPMTLRQTQLPTNGRVVRQIRAGRSTNHRLSMRPVPQPRAGNE